MIYFQDEIKDIKFYDYGGSPDLLENLIKYLDDKKEKISEINLALMIFNNEILHKKLKKLSSLGVKVNVISIPRDGYDNTKPKRIISWKSGKKVYPSATKYGLAMKIYKDHFYNSYLNYKLHMFPHIYLRSPRVKAFSRGSVPYSLHIKSMAIKFNDGSYAAILSSSNFAVRDMVKYEKMYIYETSSKEDKDNIDNFYDGLIKNSIDIKKYKRKEIDIYKYPISVVGSPIGRGGLLFTAPFLKGSNMKALEEIKKKLGNAKKEVFICAQHINEKSLLEPLKGKSIKVNILSQTNSKSPRKPKNNWSFEKFEQELGRVKGAMLSYNENIHMKFIVIDEETCILSTSNFTETQFIYKNIDIKEFKNIPGASFKGIFSEVGKFIFINDKNLAAKLIEQYKKIAIV